MMKVLPLVPPAMVDQVGVGMQFAPVLVRQFRRLLPVLKKNRALPIPGFPGTAIAVISTYPGRTGFSASTSAPEPVTAPAGALVSPVELKRQRFPARLMSKKFDG